MIDTSPVNMLIFFDGETKGCCTIAWMTRLKSLTNTRSATDQSRSLVYLLSKSIYKQLNLSPLTVSLCLIFRTESNSKIGDHQMLHDWVYTDSFTLFIN